MFDRFTASQKPDVPEFGVVLIGAGALGSELAFQLAKCAMSKVLVLDPEQLEARNLLRSRFLSQALSHEPDTDGPHCKATLLKAEAARTWKLSWNGAVSEIADTGLALLASYHVLCCCTDSALSRAETALAARLLGMPMLDCGVFGEGVSAGRVTWFATQQDAACYLCGMAENRRAQLLAYAASASLGCAAADRQNPMTGSSDAVRHTAQTAVKMLQTVQDGELPQTSTAWQLTYHAASDAWSDRPVILPRSGSCPWHDYHPGALVSLPWERPLAESLSRHATTHGDMVLQLHWPICTQAVCRNCRATAAPLHRVAWVRRRLHCSHCNGIGTLEPMSCVGAVASTDPLATCTPRQLHLPEHHLYLLRHAVAFPTPERSQDEPAP